MNEVKSYLQGRQIFCLFRMKSSQEVSLGGKQTNKQKIPSEFKEFRLMVRFKNDEY